MALADVPHECCATLSSSLSSTFMMPQEKGAYQSPSGRRFHRSDSPLRFVVAYGLIAIACLGAVYTISHLASDVTGDERLQATTIPAVFVNDDPEAVWDIVSMVS